jgi:hypothetical protein
LKHKYKNKWYYQPPVTCKFFIILFRGKTIAQLIAGRECIPADNPEHRGGEDHGLAEVQAEDGQHRHLQGQRKPRIHGQRTGFCCYFWEMCL